VTVDAAERQPREPRRSRDRYGRDRRRRQEDGSADVSQSDAAASGTSAEAPMQTAAEPRDSVEPIASIAPATAPQKTPAAPAVGGMPKVGAYALAVSELEAVASQSGLIWVNSDAEKIAKVQAAIAAEPAPIHVPRERVPAALVDHGPLILVETKRDLSQMKMPFDSEEAASPQ